MENTEAKPPDRKPDGQFSSFIQWVNKARSWIGGTGAVCFDAKGRPCRIGRDMQRAHDEGAFPVSYLDSVNDVMTDLSLGRGDGGA